MLTCVWTVFKLLFRFIPIWNTTKDSKETRVKYVFRYKVLSKMLTGDALWKWVFSGVLRDSRGSFCAGVCFLIKFLVSGLRLCWRGDFGACVYSCAFCKIFGSACFTEHLLDDCFCLFHLWYLANLEVKEKYITRYNFVYNLYIVLCFLCFILELVLQIWLKVIKTFFIK